MDQKNRYFMTTEAQNVAFRVALNDVPVRQDPLGSGHNSDAPMNAWLLQRQNKLTIDLMWPKDRPFQPNQAQFKLIFFLHDPSSQVARPLRILHEFNWPAQRPETYPFTYKAVIEEEFELPTHLWSEAEIVSEITSKDERDILDLVGRLRQSLLSGDANRVLPFVRYKSNDLARADYHTDLEEIERIDVEQLSWMLRGDNLEVSEIDDIPYVFDVVGNNQIVHLYKRDGSPALSVVNDMFDFGFDLYVARVGGDWVIAR
jgi:hypothetical protein